MENRVKRGITVLEKNIYTMYMYVYIFFFDTNSVRKQGNKMIQGN